MKKIVLMKTAAAALFLFSTSAWPDYTDKPFLESTLYPIRVYYDSEDIAQVALEQAETAWTEQIIEMDFELPLTVREESVTTGYDFYIGPEVPEGALATFEVLGDNPDTPHTDCPVFGIINSDYSSVNWVGMSVRHLLNHASLHAVDCIEPQMPTFDLFTDAVVQISMGEEDPLWQEYFLKTFQSYPRYSLDYWSIIMDEAYYPFGSALFVLFLDEHYGDGDGKLIPSLYAGTPQDGTITSFGGEFAHADVENEPDFFDSISQRLEELGSSFDETFITFVGWRFFIGSDDDGYHFNNGSVWTGCEVSRMAVHAPPDLPINDVEAPEKVCEYGSAFIELVIDGTDVAGPLEFGFRGNTAKTWAALLLLLKDGAETERVDIEIDDTMSGSRIIDSPGQYSSIVMAVANLSDGSHDPDDREFYEGDGDFFYTISIVEEEEEETVEEEIEEIPEEPAPEPVEVEEPAAEEGEDAGDGGDGGGKGCGCSIVVQ